MIRENQNPGGGFSLLEFSIMLVFVVLMLGFSIPRFTQLYKSTLVRETAKIAQLISSLRTQAILKGQNYRMVLDSVKGEYSVLVESPDMPGSFSKHPDFEEPIRLQKPIRFYNIKRTERKDEERQFAFEEFEFEKIIGTQFLFTIDSAGFIDTFDVTLRDDTSYMKFSVVDIMGTIEIGTEKEL